MAQGLAKQLPVPAPITVTKRLVLREYDAMTTAAERGTPHHSPLDPPPGPDPRHPPR